MRSGSVLLPVERFHSSYVWSEILPVIKSSANLRRCALLLNGIRLILRLTLCRPDLQGRHPGRVARLRPGWGGRDTSAADCYEPFQADLLMSRYNRRQASLSAVP